MGWKEFKISDKHVIHTDEQAQDMILYIATSAIVVVIYVPVILYYLRKFNQRKHEAVLRNRYPCLTIRSVGSIVSMLLFGTFTGFLYVHTLSEWVVFAMLICMMLHVSFFCHAVLCRVWLLYFTVCHNKAIANDAWQSIINPHKNNDDIQAELCENPNAWFLQNRGTFGSYEWIVVKLRRAVVMDTVSMSLLAVLIITLVQTGVDPAYLQGVLITLVVLFALCFLCIPCMIMFALHRNIPDFYDTTYLRHEFLFLSRTYLIATPTLLLIIMALVSLQMRSTFGMRPTSMRMAVSVDWMIASTVLTVVAVKMLHWYPSKLARMRQQDRKDTVRSKTASSAFAAIEFADSASNTDPSAPAQTTIRKRCKLPAILANQTAFAGFIEHMATEYCMESLLSMVEFSQYRDYILANEPQLATHPIHLAASSQNISVTVMSVNSDGFGPHSPSTPTTPIQTQNSLRDGSVVYFELPAGMVRSDIVFPGYYTQYGDQCPTFPTADEYVRDNRVEDRTDRLKAYRKIAYELYQKYIRDGAEFEINLAYALRHKYTARMRNQHEWLNNCSELDEEQLLALFDECYLEMTRLLRQSVSRFKGSNTFDRLLLILECEVVKYSA